jgi:hypothetical protein
MDNPIYAKVKEVEEIIDSISFDTSKHDSYKSRWTDVVRPSSMNEIVVSISAATTEEPPRYFAVHFPVALDEPDVDIQVKARDKFALLNSYVS